MPLPDHQNALRSFAADLRARLDFLRECGLQELRRDLALERFLQARPPVRPTTATTNVPPRQPALEAVAMAQSATLEAMRQELVDCQRCSLANSRSRVVFGEGDGRARLLVLGDWPTPAENESGLPFQGETGELLTRMLAAIELPRSAVFCTTLVKCMPAGDQVAVPEEITACQPFLLRQIDLVSPRLILAMGPHASRALLGDHQPFSRLRGRPQPYAAIRPPSGAITVMATYHPAFLLKNPEMKRASWQDLQLARQILDS